MIKGNCLDKLCFYNYPVVKTKSDNNNNNEIYIYINSANFCITITSTLLAVYSYAKGEPVIHSGVIAEMVIYMCMCIYIYIYIYIIIYRIVNSNPKYANSRNSFYYNQ